MCSFNVLHVHLHVGQYCGACVVTMTMSTVATVLIVRIFRSTSSIMPSQVRTLFLNKMAWILCLTRKPQEKVYKKTLYR